MAKLTVCRVDDRTGTGRRGGPNRGGVHRPRKGGADVGENLVGPRRSQLLVRLDELARRRSSGGDLRAGARLEALVEAVGVDVDALEEGSPVDDDCERHHLDAVALDELGWHLGIGVDAVADHRLAPP